MKKILTGVFISLLFSQIHFAQIEDRFAVLGEDNVKKYVKPFVTTLGSAMNSGGFYTASVSKLFGFSISFKGMMILIPDDQTKFTPVLPDRPAEPTATIYGDKGNAYGGPGGFIITPPGINKTSIPAGYPQIGLSLLGTEVILRYLPKINIAEGNDIDMFGIGVKHNVSQYIPLFPIDLSAQILYSTLTVTNLIDVSNLAFNAHASKTFGVFTPYFGLQYESSSMDLEYTIDGDPSSGDPSLQTDRDVKVSVDGDNSFRAVLGASLKLAVIVLNADVSLSSQTVISSGLTFEF
ncbi:MAG: DUF6588 family protein [Ignavibacteria bacterium]